MLAQLQRLAKILAFIAVNKAIIPSRRRIIMILIRLHFCTIFVFFVYV